MSHRTHKPHSRPRAQHPKPDVRATIPDDGRTDFAACWARLVRQWLLPSDPRETVELTVADLQAGMMELFSAGGVHHVVQARKMFDKLAAHPSLAWQAIDAAYGADDQTELEEPEPRIDPELA